MVKDCIKYKLGDISFMDKKNEEIMIEKRIIEPCLEFIEKMERMKERNQNYDEYLQCKRGEIRNYIQGGGIILPRIVVIVGTKCTLRCKDCSNLMQHYEKPYDIRIEDLLEDMQQLFSMVDYCVCINVMGGEPFIYPHLEKLLKYLIENERVGSIELTTNATKIPKESVLNLLGNEKVRVEISDYGDIEMMSSFVKAIDKYGVKIHFPVNMKWIDCGDCKPRNRNENILKELYAFCEAGKLCKSLFKGKIFDCQRGAHLLDLGYSDNIDFLDIYNCSKEDIFTFWLKDYTIACDYCNLAVHPKKFIEPAVQMGERQFQRSSCTLIPREDYEEIWKANEWYKEQLNNYQKRVTELEEWTKELQKAKDWLEEQYNLHNNENG